MAFVKLIPLARCHRGGGTFVEHDGLELAVFWLNEPERVVVIHNACPHAGGNLSGGEVIGSIVRCPWHHWEFDLDRGVSTHSERTLIRRYSATIRDGAVWVDLPEACRRQRGC